MTRFRQAVREALEIVLVASFLSLAFTFTTDRGLFGDSRPTFAARSESVAPAMIHIDEARRLFDLNKGLFIDTRHDFDFGLGHIKGAVNIPLVDFEQKQDVVRALPKDKTLVTYCDGAECNSSIELAAKLRDVGFSGVKVFFGGWQEWQAQQLPTEKTSK